MTATGYSILLVDDTRVVADAFGRLLQALGHQVRIAYNGQEALARFRERRPNVVISDISMPGMSGYELAHALRQEPTAGELVLVALSGYGQEQDQQKAGGAGFDYHLTKPATAADLRDLFSTIQNRLQKAN